MKSNKLTKALALALSVAVMLPSHVYAGSTNEAKQDNVGYVDDSNKVFPTGAIVTDLSNTDENLILDDVTDYYEALAEEKKAAKYDMVTPAMAAASDEDYSDDEIVSLTKSEVKKADNQAMKAVAALPDSVDNSKSIYFPPVDSQSGGCCTAFSEVYYQFSYTMNKARNVASTTSTSFSPYFIYAFCGNNGGSDGLGEEHGYKLLVNKGCVNFYDRTTADGFYSWTPSEKMWNKADDYRLASYQFISRGLGTQGQEVTSPDDSDLDVIKTALNNGEILSITTFIYDWKYTKIKNGTDFPENAKYLGEKIIYDTDGNEGCHRMTIVGYNDNIWCDVDRDGRYDDGEMGALKIANSWGKSYENNGFIWMAYDAINKTSCVSGEVSDSKYGDICAAGFYNTARVTAANVDSDSDFKLVYSLNAKEREDVELTVSLSNKLTGETKTSEVIPYEYGSYTNKGLQTFDGTTNQDGTMTFDLDVLDSNIKAIGFRNYTVKVTAKSLVTSRTYEIKNMYVKDYNTGDVYPITDTNSFPVVVNSSAKTFNIAKEPCNYVRIFYNGYSNPNIHYKVSGQSWTSAPGKSMIANKDMDGYNYEYMIYLGDSKSVEACFNNGSAWDSNGGNNYNFTKGVYTFNNGKITKLEGDSDFVITKFEADKTVVAKNGTVTFNVDTNSSAKSKLEIYNADKDVIYSSSYTGSNTLTYTFDTEGTFYAKAIAIENGTAKTASSDFIKIEVQGDYTKGITIYYKGVNNAHIHYQVGSGSWTAVPGIKMNVGSSVAGYDYNYQITLGNSDYANVCFNDGNGNWDSNNGNNYRLTAGTYLISNGNVIKVGSTSVTIYYSGYNNPNIHYQVGNGTWTSVPGVKMNKSNTVSGYEYEYTIQLGSADYVNFCFNDGNGNWDSNNGNNYRAYAGKYTFKNGVLNSIG